MLRTDKEKEKVEILQEKLNLLKRVFPIKMILQETQKKMIEEVPTYLELLRQVREKEEAIKCLMDSM